MFDPRMMPSARLAYVVRRLEGTVVRKKHKWVPNKSGKGGELVAHDVEVPAGFMVYFPKGHAIRLTEKQLKDRGFAEPRGGFVSMEGLTTKDPMMVVEDRMMMQMEMRKLENMTIRLAIRRTGPLLMPEQLTALGQAPGTEERAEA